MMTRLWRLAAASTALALWMGSPATGQVDFSSEPDDKTTAGTEPAKPCSDLVISPAFSSDGTAFCSHITRDGTGSATGVEMLHTSDGGRSWSQVAAIGLAVSPNQWGQRPNLMFSPFYEDDHALYASLGLTGLFRSTDDGETFSLVDPRGGSATSATVATFNTPLGELPRRVVFPQAIRGSTEGANQSVLIDAALGLRVPVQGTPAADHLFAVPPSFPDHGTPYAVAETGVGATHRFELYRCDELFDCSEHLFALPHRMRFDRIWFAPDFAVSGNIYISGFDFETNALNIWWSKDAGTSFHRWRSAQDLLDRARGSRPRANQIFAISGVSGTKLLYLRVDYATYPEGRTPAATLYRSNNGGRSWRRVAFARTFNEPPRPGRLPHEPTLDAWDGQVPGGHLVAASKRQLFLVGTEAGASGDPYHGTVASCSTDGGRNWRPLCTAH